MNLNQFIEKLKIIEKEYGSDLEVIMADGISVVSPIFIDGYKGKKVVITDED